MTDEIQNHDLLADAGYKKLGSGLVGDVRHIDGGKNTVALTRNDGKTAVFTLDSSTDISHEETSVDDMALGAGENVYVVSEGDLVRYDTVGGRDHLASNVERVAALTEDTFVLTTSQDGMLTVADGISGVERQSKMPFGPGHSPYVIAGEKQFLAYTDRKLVVLNSEGTVEWQKVFDDKIRCVGVLWPNVLVSLVSDKTIWFDVDNKKEKQLFRKELLTISPTGDRFLIGETGRGTVITTPEGVLRDVASIDADALAFSSSGEIGAVLTGESVSVHQRLRPTADVTAQKEDHGGDIVAEIENPWPVPFKAILNVNGCKVDETNITRNNTKTVPLDLPDTNNSGSPQITIENTHTGTIISDTSHQIEESSTAQSSDTAPTSIEPESPTMGGGRQENVDNEEPESPETDGKRNENLEPPDGNTADVEDSIPPIDVSLELQRVESGQAKVTVKIQNMSEFEIDKVTVHPVGSYRTSRPGESIDKESPQKHVTLDAEASREVDLPVPVEDGVVKVHVQWEASKLTSKRYTATGGNEERIEMDSPPIDIDVSKLKVQTGHMYRIHLTNRTGVPIYDEAKLNHPDDPMRPESFPVDIPPDSRHINWMIQHKHTRGVRKKTNITVRLDGLDVDQTLSTVSESTGTVGVSPRISRSVFKIDNSISNISSTADDYWEKVESLSNSIVTPVIKECITVENYSQSRFEDVELSFGHDDDESVEIGTLAPGTEQRIDRLYSPADASSLELPSYSLTAENGQDTIGSETMSIESPEFFIRGVVARGHAQSHLLLAIEDQTGQGRRVTKVYLPGVDQTREPRVRVQPDDPFSLLETFDIDSLSEDGSIRVEVESKAGISSYKTLLLVPVVELNEICSVDPWFNVEIDQHSGSYPDLRITNGSTEKMTEVVISWQNRDLDMTISQLPADASLHLPLETPLAPDVDKSNIFYITAVDSDGEQRQRCMSLICRPDGEYVAEIQPTKSEFETKRISEINSKQQSLTLSSKL